MKNTIENVFLARKHVTRTYHTFNLVMERRLTCKTDRNVIFTFEDIYPGNKSNPQLNLGYYSRPQKLYHYIIVYKKGIYFISLFSCVIIITNNCSVYGAKFSCMRLVSAQPKLHEIFSSTYFLII